MSPDRWEEIKQMIVSKFSVDYQGVEDTEDMTGTMEVVECECPIGTLRIEYVTRPRTTLGTTGGAYGKRDNSVNDEEEEVMSDTIHTLHMYVWDDNEHDWMPVNEELIKKI